MTAARRRALQIDDPLGSDPASRAVEAGDASAPGASGNATSPPSEASEASDRGSQEGQRGKPGGDRQDETRVSGEASAPTSQPARGEVWREWSGITGVGSFRLPHELLVELSDTARQLGLPIGMIVTAAITQLLDQPPERIAELVDRADDARIHGRRDARRRLRTE
jgi:hypothetical protein